MSYTFQLTDYEEEYAPPGKVMDIAVVNGTAFIEICGYEEDYNHKRTTVEARIAVDVDLLTAGLATSNEASRRDIARALERRVAKAQVTRDQPKVASNRYQAKWSSVIGAFVVNDTHTAWNVNIIDTETGEQVAWQSFAECDKVAETFNSGPDHPFVQSRTDPNEPDCHFCGVMKDFHGVDGEGQPHVCGSECWDEPL